MGNSSEDAKIKEEKEAPSWQGYPEGEFRPIGLIELYEKYRFWKQRKHWDKPIKRNRKEPLTLQEIDYRREKQQSDYKE
jgi:hypothetical protein